MSFRFRNFLIRSINHKVQVSLQLSQHKTPNMEIQNLNLQFLRNFTLLQTIIDQHPEYSCKSLTCIGTSSVCYNLIGNSDSSLDHCFCEFPFYGRHCEHDETELLKASLTSSEIGPPGSLSYRDFVLFQFFVCLVVFLFYVWRNDSFKKKDVEGSRGVKCVQKMLIRGVFLLTFFVSVF